jgi:hypothetical protein
MSSVFLPRKQVTQTKMSNYPIVKDQIDRKPINSTTAYKTMPIPKKTIYKN